MTTPNNPLINPGADRDPYWIPNLDVVTESDGAGGYRLKTSGGGGGGGGDATAANQLTQISQASVQTGQLANIEVKTDLTQSYLTASGISAADYLKQINATQGTINTNVSQIANNTNARNINVSFQNVTSNETIAAGFNSYTFVNQGTQDATINSVFLLPVGASLTLSFNPLEICSTAFSISFASTTGAKVAVIKKTP